MAPTSDSLRVSSFPFPPCPGVSVPAALLPEVEIVESRPGTTLGGVTGKGVLPGQSGNPGGRPSLAYGDSLTQAREVRSDT